MSKLSTPGERLKHARGLLGLTRITLEDEFGISHNTMSAWEIGRIPLSPKGADKLSKIFIELGLICSAAWLLGKTDERPFFLEETATGLLSANICILREVEAFKTINPAPIVIMVSDDGMLPIYEPGSYVGGNLRTGEKILDLIGANCIAQTNTGDIFFRKLLLGQNKTFILSCLNPHSSAHPILVNLKIVAAAQVIWHRSMETF